MYKVYWIHKQDHNDPKTQGYVGYTERDLLVRYEEHSNRNNDTRVGKILRNKVLNENIFITELMVSENRQECLDYEFELRPEWHVGWNDSPGGWKGGCKPGRKTGWKQTEESNAKRAAALKGNTNGTYRAVETEFDGIVFRSKYEAEEYRKKKFGDLRKNNGGQNKRIVQVDGKVFSSKKEAITYLVETYGFGKNKAIEHIDKGTPISELQIKRRSF